MALLWRLTRAFVAGLLAMAVAPAIQAQQDQSALVQIDKVRSEPLSQTVPIIGRMVARQTGVVAARTSGPVAQVRVHVGDRVKEGDLIARLVTDRLIWTREQEAAKVAKEKAKIVRVRAELKLARQELARFERLKGSAAFSGARFEDARERAAAAQGTLAEAEADLNGAEADLALAAVELDYALIRAPYPGVVTLRHTVEGAYVNAGDRIVTLINDLDLEIEADVPANRIGGLAPGVEIDVELADETRRTAAVRAVVPEENPMTRTRAVRLTPRFDPTVVTLAANASVTLYLPIGQTRKVVSVHKDAVIHRQGKSMVFVVKGDEAQPRPIRLGEAVGGRFEVLNGLTPGDLVVIRGNERLMPGQKVTYEQKS